MRLFSFLANGRWRNENHARADAVRLGAWVGFCPLDGFFYVSSRVELARPCVSITFPLPIID